MLTEADIVRLLNGLNRELQATDTVGELYLVGGAVMCLAYHARPSTHDVDAYFRPTKVIRDAAHRLAIRDHLSMDWLNDAVKGYLSDRGDYREFLNLSHLKVYVALPEYLLAMKCLAAWIGEEFHDIDDIRFLLRTLNIETYETALNMIEKYYPRERFPQKTLYLLQELLQDRGDANFASKTNR